MSEKRTTQELQLLQGLPLEVKIRKTMQRIDEWVSHFGEGGVYVSFSGGKDSTVLLDIVRNRCGYKNIPAVFVDTGLEYPEIRDHVKTVENVVWLKPKKNFKQVINDYGYPFISKEVSGCVGEGRNTRKKHLDGKKMEGETTEQAYKRLIETEGFDIYSVPYKTRNVLGWNDTNGKASFDPVPKSSFCCDRYKFLLDAPYEFSNYCCGTMKKSPAHSYARETGRKPITGQMASESRQRTSQWVQNGCNGFEMKAPISNPMSFWTEHDVLAYILIYDIKIASVYGDVVDEHDYPIVKEVLLKSGLFDNDYVLKTTGVSRTGCMFCGYGVHLEKSPNRFERMKITHPKQYDYIMRPTDQGGLNYKELIDWLNEHGNLKIKY